MRDITPAMAALDQHLASSIATFKRKASPMSLSKIKALGERSAQFHEQLGADLDKAMAKYDDLDKRKAEALAKHAGYLDLVQKDLDEAEAAVTHLTNVPLAISEN